MRKVLAAKLHGIHVTEANLHYHGSLTLDPDHCQEAGIVPMEFVEIWKNSGARTHIDLSHLWTTRFPLLYLERGRCAHLPSRRPDYRL